MAADPDIALPQTRLEPDARARCPHVLFRDVLGAQAVERLLRHVIEREMDFKPAIVRNRQTGQPRVDRRQRDCLYLRDLGPFREPFEAFVREAVPTMLTGLHLGEAAVEPRELEICAYGDGGHFGVHVDTNELTHRVRVISCVYYFAATPRRFTGGELRLHGFPVRSLDGAAVAPVAVDIAPETDTLVAFPSWLRHEVLPVSVPSGLWADRRFTINCWLLRPKPAADAGRH